MKCPSCGNAIPKGIEMCPNCGFLMEHSANSKKSFNITKYIGAVFVIMIIVLSLGYYYVRGDDNFVPSDVDYYLYISEEALNFFVSQSGEMPLNDIVGTSEIDSLEIIEKISSMTIFGWEGGTQGTVMVIKPMDKEEFRSFLNEELPDNLKIDINGRWFYKANEDMGYVALDDFYIIGSLDNVKKSIEVYEGRTNALMQKDIMGLIPASSMEAYVSLKDSETIPSHDGIIEQLPEVGKVGAIAMGISPEEGKISMVMDMQDIESASSASKKIGISLMALQALMSEEAAFEYTADSDGNYVVISLIINDLNLEDLLSNDLLDLSTILSESI